jgi:hypothetical protein
MNPIFKGLKKTSIAIAWIIAVMVMPTGALFAGMTHQDIIYRADQARGNLTGGVEWNVQIVSVDKDYTQEREIAVKSKAYDFLAKFTAPPRMKRQKLLMVKNNMWFMKPGLRKPVPISPRQRLLGGASYGDIAATNYAEDYDPTAVTEAVFRGEACYVYDLKANKKNVTYDRIKYWIAKERLVGVKAEFYTVSGKKFKSATFEYKNRLEKDGLTHALISKMIIKDTFLKENTTTLTYSSYLLVAVPASTFNINSLKTQ